MPGEDAILDPWNLVIGIMFLLQNTIGIVGNFSLLSNYLVIYYSKYTLKPIDMILTHLTIANFLIILSSGVPHIMTAFGLKQFFNDVGCRLLLYVNRVGRSMSIGTTCLLSVFQAITTCPRNGRCLDLKVKAPKYVGLSISAHWILYMVVNFITPVYVHIKWNIRNMTNEGDFEYCSTTSHDDISESLYVALLVCPEVLFSVLIIWSSGSMVVTLHRHKQLVQYIRSTKVSARVPPESRATHRILALVSTFLAFYTISSILHGCIALLNKPSFWLVKITVHLSLYFPTLSPFVMNHDSTVHGFCFVWRKNTKSHKQIRR